MHCAAVWQHSSNSNIKIVHNSIEHFLWNLISFLMMTSLVSGLFSQTLSFGHPVRQVDILGTGWTGGYRFDTKWVCSMGGYAWDIQVFCLRNEVGSVFNDSLNCFCLINVAGTDKEFKQVDEKMPDMFFSTSYLILPKPNLGITGNPVTNVKMFSMLLRRMMICIVQNILHTCKLHFFIFNWLHYFLSIQATVWHK